MRIAVVGGCASGKSTVVHALRERGFDAYIVGQEHSVVRDLWNRQHPDAVVYLYASLDAVRARRGRTWPAWLYRRQLERLSDAREHADVIVDTAAYSVGESIDYILRHLAASRGG